MFTNVTASRLRKLANEWEVIAESLDRVYDTPGHQGEAALNELMTKIYRRCALEVKDVLGDGL